MKTLSLEYLIKEPKVKTEHPPLLLLLHGYGSNDADLFSFANELPDELLIISARAPLSMGFGSYAWYTINFDNTNGKMSDLHEARESMTKIEQFIDELIATYHVNIDKSFLLGFSQGCILSYAMAFKHPDKIKNIIALSGYINPELLPKQLDIKAYKELDFYISHGSVDQVLPVEWARKSAPFLENLGIKHQYKEYPVGHGVAPQNFIDFKKWIIERL
jgi:phospholipase/carboxylesterase